MSWASRPEQGTSPRDCQHPLLQTYKFLSCLISGEKRHEVRKKPGGIWTENFLSTGVKQYMKSWSIMFRIQPLRRQVLHSMGVAGMGFGSRYSILPSCQTSQHTSRLAGCAVTFHHTSLLQDRHIQTQLHCSSPPKLLREQHQRTLHLEGHTWTFQEY